MIEKLPIILASEDLPEGTREALLTEARATARLCPHVCNDFRLYGNPYASRNLFVRYTRTNATDTDHIDRQYIWLCFQTNGTALDCEMIFSDPHTEARLKAGMIELFQTDW
jgi:hypothetical protein